MTEKYQKALEFANYRQTLNNQLRSSQIRMESQLIHSIDGGAFVIDQTLICFTDMLVRQGQKEVVLLDKNNLPVKIKDIVSFKEAITTKYFEVTNDFLIDYETIRKARSVSSLIGEK